MAFVVEDGTGTNPLANAYVNAAYVTDYATDRGITGLPVQSDIEAAIVKATDYVDSLWNKLKGSKTSETQPLQFPRENLIINGVTIDNNVLPTELLKAVAQLAIEQTVNSVSLTPTSSGQFVTHEQVGPLTVKYSDKFGSGETSTVRSVQQYLSHLCKAIGNGVIVKRG